MIHNKFSAVIFLIFPFILSGCSNDSGPDNLVAIPGTPGAPSPPPPTAEPRTSLTLSWTPTTSNVDGNATVPGEIIFYRIYYGNSGERLINNVDTRGAINEFEMSYSDFGIPNNTDYFFAVTAVNERGIESSLSDIKKFNTE
jgi:hypothetical protein